MQGYLTRDLILHLIYFQAVLLLVILWNIYLTRRIRRYPIPDILPEVSILVPARNEEHNITACLESLLAQNYPAYQVFALDDQSTDQTWQRMEEISRVQPGLTILEGAPAPGSQVGKNWACSQLAGKAQGELLLFTDADTVHHPEALITAVRTLVGSEADLLTGFPRQILGSWGERLLVPFFSWITLAFLPLGIAYRLLSPSLSSAVGQMLLFRREAYLAIGGHSGAGSSIVDDLELARAIKRAGFRWRVLSIADRISCRMYQDGKEAWAGFVKNLFAAFEFRILPFAFAFAWLLVMFWAPLVVLLLYILGLAPLANPSQLAICIGLSLLVWVFPYFHLGLPFWLAPLYPVNILANLAAALVSFRRSLAGTLEWKGRGIEAAKWKWF